MTRPGSPRRDSRDQPLIVTGTPGSDPTSVSLALYRAGVDLGVEFGDYYAPALRDVRVAALHDRLLGFEHRELFTTPAAVSMETGGASGGTSADGAPTGSTAAGDSAMAELARDALAVGRPPGVPWGWSEQRTSFLVPFWESVYPEARWLLVLSPPEDGARSALRDPGLSRRVSSPIRRARHGLRVWLRAAAPLADLADRAGDRCCLLDPRADFTGAGAHRLAEVLEGWGYEADAEDIAEVFERYRPTRESLPWLRRLARLDRSAARVSRRLAASRVGQISSKVGGPSVVSSPRAAPSHISVAIVASGPRYSQTFVHGLARSLPCRVTSVAHTNDRFRAEDLELRTGLERALESVRREFGFTGTGVRDRAFARFLRRRGIDVVLAQFGPHAVAALPGCLRAGVPLVAHFRGFDAHRESILSRHAEGYREVFEHAAAIVTSSRSIADHLVALGAPTDRIVSTSSGADTWSFRTVDPASNPPEFVAVGRFVEKKGPLLTLLAFRQVAEALPEARLTMVGDGLLLGPCIQMARSLGIDDRVAFPGARDPWDVAEHMAGARAFVQHSLTADDGDSEGTPVAILEAAAIGLPIVSTAHAGIVEAVRDGVTGFLVPEGDVETMAERMIRLGRDPDLARRLGRAGREHVLAHHSREAMVERVWQVVQDVTGGAVGESPDRRGAAAPEPAAHAT